MKNWEKNEFNDTLGGRLRRYGQISKVSTNEPEYLGSIPSRVIPETKITVLDAALLNTQNYKERIKGKVELCRKKSSALPYTSV